MDPFEKQFRRRANVQAIIAFFVGVAIAYAVGTAMNVTSSLFTLLIVLAVGGLWYHIRKVV